MIAIQVQYDYHAAQAIQVLRDLKRATGSEFGEGAAIEVSVLVRTHLEQLAATRHATATRLQAQPTGHLEEAAASVLHGADAAGSYVSITSPGIRRAVGSYTIKPRQAKALTIPVHRLSYGQRVGELKHRGIQIFRPKAKANGKPKDYLAAIVDGRLEVLYLLRKSVAVPQDRTLLPTDTDLSAAATQGARNVLAALLQPATPGGAA